MLSRLDAVVDRPRREAALALGGASLAFVIGLLVWRREARRSIKRPLATLLTAGAVLVGGCGSYFAPDRNIKDRLEESAVLGSWFLTDRSLTLLKRDGFTAIAGQKYSLRFDSDRTCLLDSVLDDFTGGSHVTTACTWRLEHDTKGDSNVSKANALRIDFELKGASHGRFLNFAREGGALILWNYYGDPDTWEFLEYSRDGGRH